MHVDTLIIFSCIFNWFPTIELLTFKVDGMSLSCLAIILSHLGCSPYFSCKSQVLLKFLADVPRVLA